MGCRLGWSEFKGVTRLEVLKIGELGGLRVLNDLKW